MHPITFDFPAIQIRKTLLLNTLLQTAKNAFKEEKNSLLMLLNFNNLLQIFSPRGFVK